MASTSPTAPCAASRCASTPAPVNLIGANGAGKTTTIRSISWLLRPTTGAIRFEGQPIHAAAPEAIVARGIVQVSEGRRVFPELTVEENLRVGA
jgi:branched-chain amino acid transport system ATP-binding protein